MSGLRSTRQALRIPMDAASNQFLRELARVGSKVRATNGAYKEASLEATRFLSAQSPLEQRFLHAGPVATKMARVNQGFRIVEQEFHRVHTTPRVERIARAYADYLHSLVVETRTYVSYAKMCLVKESLKDPKFVKLARAVRTTTAVRDRKIAIQREVEKL